MDDHPAGRTTSHSLRLQAMVSYTTLWRQQLKRSVMFSAQSMCSLLMRVTKTWNVDRKASNYSVQTAPNLQTRGIFWNIQYLPHYKFLLTIAFYITLLLLAYQWVTISVMGSGVLPFPLEGCSFITLVHVIAVFLKSEGKSQTVIQWRQRLLTVTEERNQISSFLYQLSSHRVSCRVAVVYAYVLRLLLHECFSPQEDFIKIKNNNKVK